MLLDLDTGNYYELGGVAFEIWEALDGTRTMEAIAEDLCKRYEVEYDESYADVTSFVAQLEKLNSFSEPHGHASTGGKEGY